MGLQKRLYEKLNRRPHYNGPAYDPTKDRVRLTGQTARVFEALRPGAWFTLDELADITGDPPASISAQIRHLRKPRFGGFTVDRRRRGNARAGLWEYQLRP